MEVPVHDEASLTVNEESAASSQSDPLALETNNGVHADDAKIISFVEKEMSGNSKRPLWENFPSNGGLSLAEEEAEADIIRKYVVASRSSMVTLSLNERNSLEPEKDGILKKKTRKRKRRVKLLSCSKKTERIVILIFGSILVGLLIYFIVEMLVMANNAPKLYQGTTYQNDRNDTGPPPGGHPGSHSPHHGGHHNGNRPPPQQQNGTHTPHPPHPPYHNNSGVPPGPPPSTNGTNATNITDLPKPPSPPSDTIASSLPGEPQLVGFIQAPFDTEELVYLVENNNVVHIPEDGLGDLDTSNSTSFVADGGATIYCGTKVDGIAVLVQCRDGVPLCQVYTATTSDQCSQVETDQ